MMASIAPSRGRAAPRRWERPRCLPAATASSPELHASVPDPCSTTSTRNPGSPSASVPLARARSAWKNGSASAGKSFAIEPLESSCTRTGGGTRRDSLPSAYPRRSKHAEAALPSESERRLVLVEPERAVLGENRERGRLLQLGDHHAFADRVGNTRRRGRSRSLLRVPRAGSSRRASPRRPYRRPTHEADRARRPPESPARSRRRARSPSRSSLRSCRTALRASPGRTRASGGSAPGGAGRRRAASRGAPGCRRRREQPLAEPARGIRSDGDARAGCRRRIGRSRPSDRRRRGGYSSGMAVTEPTQSSGKLFAGRAAEPRDTRPACVVEGSGWPRAGGACRRDGSCVFDRVERARGPRERERREPGCAGPGQVEEERALGDAGEAGAEEMARAGLRSRPPPRAEGRRVGTWSDRMCRRGAR